MNARDDQEPSNRQDFTSPTTDTETPLDELHAAIRRTMNEIQPPGGNHSSHVRDSIRTGLDRLKRYHTGADATSIAVAADIVRVLAICQFPQACFATSIERWSQKIAESLLEDPVGREQLGSIWMSQGLGRQHP